MRSYLLQRFVNVFYHLPKAILANIRFGFPSRGMNIVCVTGTDGKTTTSNMIYHILSYSGLKVGLISSIHQKSSASFGLSKNE
jgi:UDP-N-acetylmuramoyl-L-alanyl-D-glutamate--2,6-diaminopimelate ligase